MTRPRFFFLVFCFFFVFLRSGHEAKQGGRRFGGPERRKEPLPAKGLMKVFQKLLFRQGERLRGKVPKANGAACIAPSCPPVSGAHKTGPPVAEWNLALVPPVFLWVVKGANMKSAVLLSLVDRNFTRIV